MVFCLLCMCYLFIPERICSAANHVTLCCCQSSMFVVAACRQDIKLDIYDWQEADGQLETKWRVSGIVQLPWRPLLAAAGGTTHVFSQVCVVSRNGNLLSLLADQAAAHDKGAGPHGKTVSSAWGCYGA